MTAIDFPSTPSNGQEVISGGTTYVWNGVGWAVKPAASGYTKAEADAKFVDVAGDNMTGNLSIVKSNPLLALVKSASGETSYILGYKGAFPRWQFELGNSVAESGSGNVGSDFSLSRFSDAGAYIDSPLYIGRTNGAASFSSTLTVRDSVSVNGASSAGFSAALNTGGRRVTMAVGATFNLIDSYNANLLRWRILPGDATTESGTNTGSNFAIASYNDSGVQISTPLSINRASGRVSMPNGLDAASISVSNLSTTAGGPATINGILSVNGAANFVQPAAAAWGTTYRSPNYGLLIDVGTAGNASDYLILGRNYTAGQTLFSVTCDGRVIAPLLTIGGVATMSGDVNIAGNDNVNGIVRVGAAAAGGTIFFGNTGARYLQHDGAGTLYVGGANISVQTGGIYISGASQQPGGGPWGAGPQSTDNTDVVGDYESGLAEILALRPKRYAYRAAPDVQHIGLLPWDIEQLMPEMVSMLADEPDSNLRSVNANALTYALVNAVKQLAAKVGRLELELASRPK